MRSYPPAKNPSRELHQRQQIRLVLLDFVSFGLHKGQTHRDRVFENRKLVKIRRRVSTHRVVDKKESTREGRDDRFGIRHRRRRFTRRHHRDYLLQKQKQN